MRREEGWDMIDDMRKGRGKRGQEEKRVEQGLRRGRGYKARMLEIEAEESGRGTKATFLSVFIMACLLSPWRNLLILKCTSQWEERIAL
jgi:hypothetical protein